MKKIFFRVQVYLVLAIGACAVLYLFRASLTQQPAHQPHSPTQTAAASGFEPRYEPPQPVASQKVTPSPDASPAKSTVIAPLSQTGSTPFRKRAWDSNYLANLGRRGTNTPIRFELVSGTYASGIIRHIELRHGDVLRISGDLNEPENGRFFFQKQSLPGKAGDFAGLVEFPASRKAYRIEPTGPGGTSEFVERRLDEVICELMPQLDNNRFTTLGAEEIPPLDPQDVPDLIPPYNSGIISLQSRQGSTGVLYIDYRGGYTPTWGGITYQKPSVSNAQIKDVWKRVAEDYMPFNINVTTDIRVYETAPENSRQRVIVTPTTTAAPSAGGVAYMNSWNWTGDTPCWAFYSTGKSAAEVISHEAGHTLSLGHDGRTTPSEGYFGGHGSGATGWAPIMGVGYYQPVAQWSKGEYQYANNTEDDLAKIIANNNSVDPCADDIGGTLTGARWLEIATNFTVFAEGVIETTADTDAFRFTTSGGQVSLTAVPVGDWADLAIQTTLADATDVVIASNSPQTTLYASLATNLAAGTYTFRVTGAGRNSALTNGFSDYASLGYYMVTGRVTNARLATYLSIAENSTNGTLVGSIPATNPNGDALLYTIVTGNVASAFSLNNGGVLKVDNAVALNYEAFSTTTRFPVQYELFVTISNTVTPALTEENRRVVVQLLDVNETPSISGFNATILAHTLPGTTIGNIVGSDPDAYSYLTYAITSGNSEGSFAISSDLGTLTVAADIPAATQTIYTLTVRATNNGIPAKTADATIHITVIPNSTGLNPGSISYAVYNNIGSGTYVTNLTLHPRFPLDPDWETQRPLFEGNTDRADSYGAVMRGYLIPPVSGTYTFWIASDDNSELWMSTTANPASRSLIAYITGGYTSPRQWTKYASQKSADRALVAGQAYYVEARMKEGGGGDNLAVAWKGPATANLTNVISGFYLAPHFMNYVPRATGFTNSIRRNLQAGSKAGQIKVTDVNANDVPSFAITAGDDTGIFSLDQEGWVRVTDEAALQSASSPVTLTVRVTDNGTPALSGTATVELTLADTNSLTSNNLRRELFNNIGSGSAISDLTGNAKYPNRPDALTSLTNFATPVNVADAFGSRIRAYVTVPTNGDYRFFIASDDASQLKFSRNGNPANVQTIASVSGWTNPNVFTQYVSQVSALQTNLVVGQKYYIEALHKEGGGGDHLSVAWSGPGLTGTNIIESAYLTSLDINHAPQVTNHILRINYTNLLGHWIGRVAATDSPLDSLSFKITSGNTGGTFAINPDTGDLTLASTALTASLTEDLFVLKVTVQDSGYGGLYPLHEQTATVTMLVIGPPFMSAVAIQGDALRFVWETLPGIRYQFQSTTNLMSPSWSNIGTPINGTGNPLTNAIPIDTDPAKYFRLLLLE